MHTRKMLPAHVVRAVLPAAIALATAMTSVPAMAATQLEEVVVTARKRVENIQDVPVAVTAIAGADIENAFTVNTTSLAQFAPNVVLDTIEMGTPAGGGFSIRGIAYQDVDKGFDPTVLVSVDGVPISTGTGQVFDLIDIERIEVLRGPQGTLFGKNVVGGLINIFRTKPKLDEQSGKIRARYGEYKKASTDFLYNYGGDTMAVKLTGGMASQDKGFFENPTRGRDVGKTDTDRAGVHFLWQPNDTYTGEIQFNYSNVEGDATPAFNIDIDSDFSPGGYADIFCLISGQCSNDPGEPSSGDRDVSLGEWKTPVELEQWQVTTQHTVNFADDYQLTYIGSYLTFDDVYEMDGDGTPLPIYSFRRWGDFDQLSQELRLSRDTGSIFTWQVGAYTEWAEGTNKQLTDLRALNGFNDWVTREEGVTESNTYSIFGEGDLALLDDKLVFTAGARYISQTKKLARELYNFQIDDYELAPNSGGQRTDSEIIYRLGARYNFTDDVMAYFTTSTGFRSGGLSPRAQTPAVLAQGYEPEKLTNYELGLRTTLFDGRMIFNATVFHMDYKDMQIELAVPVCDANGCIAGRTQLALENAGKAKIDGVELDLQFQVTDWWRMTANVGYLDAKYDELFVNIWGDLDANGDLLPANDESDLTMRRAPEWTWAIQSMMDWDVSSGHVSLRVGYDWRDDYEGTITNYPGTRIESFGILNSSVSYEVQSWKFSVFGSNLTDEDSWTHTYAVNPTRPNAAAPFSTLWRFATQRNPREVGLEVMYQF